MGCNLSKVGVEPATAINLNDLSKVVPEPLYPVDENGACNHLYCEQWGDQFHCCDCQCFVEDENIVQEERRKIESIVDHSSPKDAINRGVTIGFLLDFAKKNNCLEMSTRDVRRKFIMPATRSGRCRYVELPEMEKCTGRAVTFISHTWGAKFGDLVAAVLDGNADRNRIVWVDIFAVRQWPSHKPDLDFTAVVKQCGAFMIVCSSHDEIVQMSAWDRQSRKVDAIPTHVRTQIAFLRVWCLVEIHEAIVSGIPIILKGGSHRVEGDSLAFVTNEHMTGKLSNMIDIEAADATVLSDKDRILNEIRASVGVGGVNETIRGVITGSHISGRQPIIQCAACGDVEALEELRKNPSEYIASVAGCGYAQLLQVMVDLGGDVNAHNSAGMSPITAAAYGGRASCIELLIKAGCDVNSTGNGFTAVSLAAFGGFLDCLEVLLKHECDVNFQDSKGISALMCAAQGGHIECIQALLKYGADFHLQSNNQFTVLMHAAKAGHVACVEYLLAQDCPVSVVSTEGATALLLAAQGGHTACVDLLHGKGADVNAKTHSSATALHLAALHGHTACIEYLLSKGCDPSAQNNNDETALGIAKKKGFTACVEILQNAAAELQQQQQQQQQP